jgi:hypothetical protein
MIRALIFIFLLSQNALAQTLRSPESVERDVQTQLTQSQMRHPAFAALAEQQPDFLSAWRTQLREQLIVLAPKQWPAASDAVALAESLNVANRYLMRADDKRVDAYFQQQRLLLDAARRDSRLCSRLLNTAISNADERYNAPWLMQAGFRKNLSALHSAVAGLVLQAQTPRRLPAEQNQLFMQRLISRMAQRFGAASLREYELIENENADPMTRCKAVWQVAETMHNEPLELRAHLVRIYFGR